jgi:hypothetical protein
LSSISSDVPQYFATHFAPQSRLSATEMNVWRVA